MSFSIVGPHWRKPTPVASDRLVVHDLTPDQLQPITLQAVNGWDVRWQLMLFRVLLPVNTLMRFGVDPITLTDAQGRPALRAIPGEGANSIRLELYHAADAVDALVEMELADTPFNQLEVLWVAIQDPQSPRFDIDVTPDGTPTLRGILRRNLAAEEAALRAGLAPGQVRRGLGTLDRMAAHLESFMACLNQRQYFVQPLYYHTAVLFERLGFSYIYGQARMEEIGRGFAPGGELRARLDGATPFRAPALADTVRGRAWAIHDGVMGRDWDRVRMVKRLGLHAGVDTCPNVPW